MNLYWMKLYSFVLDEFVILIQDFVSTFVHPTFNFLSILELNNPFIILK